MSGIAAAASLWTAGDREGAFEALCAVWAQTQDVELAELCEDISEFLLRKQARASLLVAAQAGDRVAVHALLPWMIGLPQPKDQQRLAFLDPPDPVLLRYLAYWSSRRPELDELAHYLAEHRSGWLDRLNAWLNREGPSEIPHYLFERPPREADGAPSSAERDALTALRTALLAERSVARVQADVLLQRVHERPNDDAHRALLADFLLSQDQHDPRGEFINLQLRAAAGPLPESARARERELLDLHGFRWLGPLAHECHLPAVRFERGFVVAIDLFKAPSELRSLGHPIWATVETLYRGMGPIVGHPVMRSLRKLDCDSDCAEALLNGPVCAGLEALAVTFVEAVNPKDLLSSTHARELFRKLDAVPDLRHLRLRDRIAADADAWQWMWKGPRAGLASVRFYVGREQPHLSRWIEQLRRDRARVDLLLDYEMYGFALLPADGYRTVRVRRLWGGWGELKRNNPFVEAIAPSLRGMGLRRIEIVGEIVDVDRVRASLQRHCPDADAVEIVAV